MTHFVEGIEEHMMPTGPIDVRVIGTEKTETSAPDFSAWFTLQLAGTEPAQRLIPFNIKREHAVITVIAGAAGNVNGSIYVGSRDLVENGSGGQLRNGSSVTVKGRRDLWVKGDGINSLWVTVVDERWA